MPLARLLLDKDEAASGGPLPRTQVPVADTWDLSSLYPDGAAWSSGLARLQAEYPRLVARAGHLAESAQTLRETLELDRELDLQIERLGHYASLRSSEDGAEGENLAREAQFQNVLTRMGEATAFFGPELQAIPDDQFEQFLADPELAEWVVPLQRIRRRKPHTLSEPEERLLASCESVLSGHQETFGQLTDVDMRFGVLIDEANQERPLTQSSYSSFLMQRDPEVRRQAFHQFYREYGEHQYTIATSFANSVRADVFRARARRHPSARAAALFSDDVPLSVYDNLIGSVRANLQPLFRYYALRRRVLKLSEIHHYDTYVPLVAAMKTKVTFAEATERVLAAVRPLGEEYGSVLGRGLCQERWCDRYENKGKRSGAFSSSSYGNPPYLLMNYKEDVFSDVYTLAHEAGHSMHTWYAQRTQPYQTYHYPIFLAEVASTFNEELLTHHLLEETSDPAMRAYLISRQIDDIRGTVYRQTMFAEFEKIVHEMEERGEPLTLDTFRQAYRGLLEAYFGPEFALDPELELECLRIPHFYNAFYVYKYATGISAAVALSEQVLAGGSVERYLDFLRSGGSRFPIPTLQAAGVDMSSPEPVEATLRLFARRVEELETLLA